MRTPTLLALLAATSVSFAAEDGAQVYNTLCVACHGPDGKGLNGQQLLDCAKGLIRKHTR